MLVPKLVTNDYIPRAVAASAPELYREQEGFFEGCAGPSHAYFAVLRGNATLLVDSDEVQLGESDALLLDGEHDVKVTGSATLLRFCYVDATNYVAARRWCAANPRESFPHAGRDVKADTVGRGLSNGDFDTRMDRDPKPLPWQTYLTWPREEKEQDYCGKPDVVEDDSLEAPVAVPRSKRKRGGGGNFQDWAIEQKWRWTVVARTIPELAAPTVTTERHSATLKLKSSYSPKHGDDSKFGFQVEWAAGDAFFDAAAAWTGEVVFDGLSTEHVASVKVVDLASGSQYRFRVAVLYGEVLGSWSEWSAEVATMLDGAPKAPAAPLVVDKLLAIAAPDHGGSPVLGYGVRWRSLSKLDHGGWHSLGSFSCSTTSTTTSVAALESVRPSADIDHLVEFEVAAYNKLGLSAWSSPSVPSKIEPTGGKHRVLGRGAAKRSVPHHLGADADDALKAELEQRAHAPRTTGPIAVVDSEGENFLEVWDAPKYGVNMALPALKLQCWFAHWSPKHYSVAAELAWADPPDGSTALSNSDAVRLRVCVVRRGKAPLVVLAQRCQAAGALAVVILDDGTCSSFDQYCVPGASRAKGEGFAMRDLARPWLDVHVPVLLVAPEDLGAFMEHNNKDEL